MKLVILSDCFLKKRWENPDLLLEQEKRLVRALDWFDIEHWDLPNFMHYRVWIQGEAWLIYKPYARIEF